MNNYYNFVNSFVPGTKVRSDDMNNELDGITAGFDELPSDPESINRGTTYVGTESGSGNTYVVARVNTQTSYQNGDHVGFFATHDNTGSGTLNVDGLGAVALVAPDGSALLASDMTDGVYYEAVFDTANNRWQLMTPMAGTLTEADNRVSWAEEWAINPEDTLVSTAAGGNGVDDYSSLHWSAKASDSATAASSSETNAATSESNSADNVDYSQEWAINPEDSAVSVAAGGDGSTTFSALHWSAKAEASAASLNAGTLIERKVFTASGTWTKPADLAFAIVTVISGGAGGGATATAGTVASVGGSGGGGGAMRAEFSNADLGATEAITVGSGGSGGVKPSGSGGASGLSRFGTSAAATSLESAAAAAGLGGGTSSAGVSGAGGATTAGANATEVVEIAGQDGNEGSVNANSIKYCTSGSGGSTGLGYGLGAGSDEAQSGAFVGKAGTGYGGGGAGGVSVGNTTGADGGPGVAGIIIVESYS